MSSVLLARRDSRSRAQTSSRDIKLNRGACSISPLRHVLLQVFGPSREYVRRENGLRTGISGISTSAAHWNRVGAVTHGRNNNMGIRRRGGTREAVENARGSFSIKINSARPNDSIPIFAIEKCALLPLAENEPSVRKAIRQLNSQLVMSQHADVALVTTRRNIRGAENCRRLTGVLFFSSVLLERV